MAQKLVILAVIAAMGSGTAALSEGRGAAFDTLDADNNGQVTEAEMRAAQEARFAAADTNGDGVLSEEEIAARSSQRAAERAKRMISRLDSNDDGALSQAELNERRDIGRVFARLDANDDGSISEDEFAEGRKKMRKRMRDGAKNGG
jgi:Ca2+-binding EF-hand superfamily protein